MHLFQIIPKLINDLYALPKSSMGDNNELFDEDSEYIEEIYGNFIRTHGLNKLQSDYND